MGRIADAVSSARILVYDLETRPGLSWSFNYRDEYLSPAQMVTDPGVMAWSAQWVGEKKVRFASDHHDGHADMIGSIHELISSAQIVVGFNHVGFDNPWLEDEFTLADLPSPQRVPQVDLYRVVRQNYKRLAHKKLAYVLEHFGLSDKMSNDGWPLWTACCTDPETGAPYLGPVPKGGGCPKAWRQMKSYARQDTAITTELYEFLKPRIRNHPHVGLYGGNRNGCPVCGSDDRSPAKHHKTSAQSYPAWRCDACGHTYRAARALPNTATGTRSI